MGRAKSQMLFRVVGPEGSTKLAYGFVSGVYGCAGTGNTDEDMGPICVCPDSPVQGKGVQVDWLAPQFPGDSGAYCAPSPSCEVSDPCDCKQRRMIANGGALCLSTCSSQSKHGGIFV